MSSDIAAAVAPGQLDLLDLAAVGLDREEGVRETGSSLPDRAEKDAQNKSAAAVLDVPGGGQYVAFHGTDSSRSSFSSVHSKKASPGGAPDSGKTVLEVGYALGKCALEKRMKLRTHRQGSGKSDEEDAFLKEAVNIRRLWNDVKDPKTSLGADFQEEVNKLLRQQELDCLLPEDRLDQPTAEYDIFANWLHVRLGKNYNTALLLLTKLPWLDDKPTSLLLERLIEHNSRMTSPQDPAFVAADPATGNTPLHQLARLNFTDSAHVLFRQYPELWRIENMNGNLPLEVAIDNSCSKIAVKLMDDMPNDHVRDLFKKRRRFADILSNPKMKDSAHAVLDRLVAAWPDEEGAERGHDFYYQPLESDSKGRMPGDEGFNGMNTCFMNIMRKKKLNQEFGNKRVVRMLLNAKWKSYGEKMLWISASAFFLFILVLTYATEAATGAVDPTSYSDGALDIIRAICEVVVLIVLAALFVGEVIELVESRHDCRGYWTDHYNLAQITSFSLLFVVVPLRYADPDGRAQWIFLSLGYFITMARSFKFISTSSLLGVYTRVITGILARVMPKFIVVFGFILVAWAGAWYPALRSNVREENGTQTDIGLILETSSYWENMFLGVRVMIEGRNLIDYYNNKQQLGGLAVFFYVAFLAFVTLIMRTILIAQMAATYNTLNRDAVRQLELNRSWVLPSLEQASLFNGKFSVFGNWRLRYYNESESISDKELQKLLQEEKVDGFVHLERLLNRQKCEQDMKQLQLLQHIDHQTVLEEKWNKGILLAVADSRQELMECSKLNRDTAVAHGNTTVVKVTDACNALGSELTTNTSTQQAQVIAMVQGIVDKQSEAHSEHLSNISGQLRTQSDRYDRLESLLAQLGNQISDMASPRQQATSDQSQTEEEEERRELKIIVEKQTVQLQQLTESKKSLEEQNAELSRQLQLVGLQERTTSPPATAPVPPASAEKKGFFQRLGDRVDDALGDDDEQ